MYNTIGKKTASKHKGLRLTSFVIIWLLICVLTIGAAIFAPEIKEHLCVFNDKSDPGINTFGVDLPDVKTNIDSGEFDIRQKDELRRERDECGRNAQKEDLPVLNPSEQESLRALYEELKKPVNALCNFLKTDDIKYFYGVLSPDFIAYLKEKYQDAILLLGGESSAVKSIIDENLLRQKSLAGKLTGISCNMDICGMRELNRRELSEMSDVLTRLGAARDIERGYKLRLRLVFTGEFTVTAADKTVRLTETEAGWFIFPPDLMRSGLKRQE